MNRPKYRNALSRQMTREMDAAFGMACEDPSVKVIILKGEGGNFSSGHDMGTKEQLADLKAAGDVRMKGPARILKLGAQDDLEMCLKWRQLSKPLIGGVNGVCIFHAFAVASVCDVLLAAEDARFLPAGAMQYCSIPWDMALKVRKAKEILFTRRFILATEAEELGIVNRVVPTESLDAELLAMARVIGKADPFHLRMMKLTVNQAQDAVGLTSSVRSGIGNYIAWRWDQQAQGGPKLGFDKQALVPTVFAETEEVMYLSETAATSAAANRRRSKL